MKVCGLILLISFTGCHFFKLYKDKQGIERVRLERFDGVCGYRRLPIMFSIQSMMKIGKKLYMNDTYNATENINTNMDATVHIERCRFKENLDSCEKFYDFYSDQYCVMLYTSPLMSGFEPPFRCPLKKGIYKSINNVLDVEAFLLFPVERWYWRVNITVGYKDSKRVLLSICTEFYFNVEE